MSLPEEEDDVNLIQYSDINTTDSSIDSSRVQHQQQQQQQQQQNQLQSTLKLKQININKLHKKQQIKQKNPLIKSTKPTIFSYIYSNSNTILNKFIMTYEEQLQRAITKGNTSLCTDLVVTHGCDVNLQVDNKFPICLACEYDQFEIVDLLIKYGADVNQFDFYDQSALIYAVDSASLNLIKLLIKNGASVNICDSNGVYPLHVAINRHDNEICDYLLSKKAPLNSPNM